MIINGEVIMKIARALSLTALMSLSVAGCSTLMSDNSPAPVDSMSVSGTTVNTTNTVNNVPTTVNSNTGVMMGGTLGGDVGKSMDDSDNTRVNQALEANKTNQPLTWTNPSSNTTYTITPTRTFTSPTGEPCRDFTASALINGQTQQVYSTACRDSSGQWHVVSS